MNVARLVRVGHSVYLHIPQMARQRLKWEEGDFCEVRVLLDDTLKVRKVLGANPNGSKTHAETAAAGVA